MIKALPQHAQYNSPRGYDSMSTNAGTFNRELAETTDTMRVVGNSTVALSGLFAQWLRGLTINAHERLAIAHLWKTGPMTMSELGSRIPLSRAAITALTDRLEALNYVVRTPDQQDRRRTVLSLTDRPFELMQGITASWIADIEAIEADFDEAELAAVARYHERIGAASELRANELRARRDEELPTAG